MKHAIYQRLTTDAVKHICDRRALNQATFNTRDAVDWFAQTLRFIEPEIYRPLEAPKHARRLLPVTNVGPRSAGVPYVYRMLSLTAEVQQGTSESNDAIVSGNVVGGEYTGYVREFLGSWEYTINDEYAIELSGQNGQRIDIIRDKADAVREGFEQRFEALAWIGNSAAGLAGAANHSAVNALNLITDATGVGQWQLPATDIDELNSDIRLAKAAYRTQTRGAETPDTFLLPDTLTDVFAQRLPNTTATFGEFVRSAHPELTFDFVPALSATFTSGAEGRGILFKRNPRYGDLVVPQEFMQSAPQVQDFRYRTACRMVFGGWRTRYPVTMLYVDGLTQPA